MQTTTAEEMLLSSILRNGDLTTALAHGLSGKMFHIYPAEYEWIEQFYLKHRKTPSKEAFKLQFPKFQRKVADDTAHYTEKVRAAHTRISLLRAQDEINDRIAAGDIPGALDFMRSASVQITGDMGMIDDGDVFRDNDDILADFEMRRKRYEEFGSAGIPSGFPTFDERVGGFGPGELHIVAARAGVGKSWLMQAMAAYAAMSGAKVQFDALEQTRAQVTARILSIANRDSKFASQIFQSTSLMQGKDYDPREFQKYLARLRNEVKGALHVSDSTRGRVTVATVASQIERNNPAIVYVDYLTLMGKKSNDWQGVAELSSELTQLAGQYDIPIVAAAQLNRQGTSKERGLETIAQADAIGQDASGVIFLRQRSPSVMEAKMEKNRNGQGGFTWYMKFQPHRGIFHEITYEVAAELEARDKEEAEMEEDNR